MRSRALTLTGPELAKIPSSKSLLTVYIRSMSGCGCGRKATKLCVLSRNILLTCEPRAPPLSLPGSMRVYCKVRVIFLRETLACNFSHRWISSVPPRTGHCQPCCSWLKGTKPLRKTDLVPFDQPEQEAGPLGGECRQPLV